jgi:hypothetical protein
MLPTATVQRHRKRQEQWRLSQARCRVKYPTKKTNHHNYANERRKRDNDWESRPFIMWDGEGPQDAGYALFGNSEGYEICHPFLSTKECLELIIECEQENPDAIHIGYGFNYDVSMILKDLPWRQLTALHHFNRTIWRDWEIEHIPHKWFKVKHGEVTCTIYDIRSFFAGGYLDALQDFGVGTERERERIAHGKASRETFQWSEIKEIREYWKLELKLGPVLAGKLRKVFADAGYVPRSWHGPGALARMALKRHKVYDAMAVTPKKVQEAARYAFAGGRFELFKAGHVQGKVYNADIRSAYPFFATKLPNLSKGKWKHVRRFDSEHRFGVYHCRYSGHPESWQPNPLFRRMDSGSVAWPYRTEGWFWAPEAELVKESIVEGWVFVEDNPNDRPFEWLNEYYLRRQRLKGMGNAAEYTFKLIINSVYGQLAQRAGWDRKRRQPPKSHQLEWAGYITSGCRARVYRLARECGDKIVSIDTDGVASLAPFAHLDSGNRLGDWELTEYDDGIFWQSGIYSLKTGDSWVKAKTRGIPKGSYTAEQLLECLRLGRPLSLSKKVFVTYGLADDGRRHEHNTWKLEPHEFVMGGDGKRVHFPRACKTECDGSLHRLGMPQFVYGPDGSAWSKPHSLPWLEPPDDNRKLMDDLTLFDANHLDVDDLWVLSCQ